MSCSLYWKPIIENSFRVGDHILRNAIENRYSLPTVIGFSAKNYLEGLRDAGVNGAEDLLEAIEKHGEIEVYNEC